MCALSNLWASYYGTRKQQNIRSFLERGHPQARAVMLGTGLHFSKEVTRSASLMQGTSDFRWDVGDTENWGMRSFTHSFNKPTFNHAVRARRAADAISCYVGLDEGQSRGILSA